MTATTITSVSLYCNRCRWETYGRSELELINAGWSKYAPGTANTPINHLCPDCTTGYHRFMTGQEVPALVERKVDFGDKV